MAVKPKHGSAQTWAAADRRVDVVLMRESGKTFNEIARQLGVSRSRARQIYQRGKMDSVARWRWFERVVSAGLTTTNREDA